MNEHDLITRMMAILAKQQEVLTKLAQQFNEETEEIEEAPQTVRDVSAPEPQSPIYATFVGPVRSYNRVPNDMRLYHLSHHIPCGHNNSQSTDYVVISARPSQVLGIAPGDESPVPPETFIFASNKDGVMSHPQRELPGSFKGEANHAEAIRNAGWILKGSAGQPFHKVVQDIHSIPRNPNKPKQAQAQSMSPAAVDGFLKRALNTAIGNVGGIYSQFHAETKQVPNGYVMTAIFTPNLTPDVENKIGNAFYQYVNNQPEFGRVELVINRNKATKTAQHEPRPKTDHKDPAPKIGGAMTKLINEALRKAGFDGRGRFRTVGHAHGEAGSILQQFNLQFTDMLSAWDVKGDSGVLSLGISKGDPTDPFWAMPVSNAMMHFSYTKLAEDKFEVIAYL